MSDLTTSISYETISKFGQPFKMAVKLAGRLVGHIAGSRSNGYQYTAKSGNRGEVYPTLRACQESLEAA